MMKLKIVNKHYKLIDLKEKDFKSVGMEIKFLDDIKTEENERANLQVELDDILSKLNDIKSKKYNIFDFFIGTKKKDYIITNNLQQNVLDLKTQLSEKTEELELDKANYEKLQNEMKNDDEQMQNLRKELKYPFKDYTLIPDFEDGTYIESEYYLKVSLDRLINKKDFYVQKLEELKFMRSYANSKELTITNEKEEFYEKAI